MLVVSKFLRAFVKFVDTVSLVGAALAAVALALIALIMGAEIVARSAFGFSLEFSWEYAAYLMAASFFLGAAYTLRKGSHIRMGAAIEQFSPRIAMLMDVFATLIGLTAMLLVAHALIDLAWNAHLRGSVSFTPMATYMAIPQALPAIGAVMVILQLLARLVCHGLGLPVEKPVDADGLTVDR